MFVTCTEAAALALPTAFAPKSKARELAVNKLTAFTPLPSNDTRIGPPEELLVKLKVAVSVPTRLAWN
jgi:hypothetical protein